MPRACAVSYPLIRSRRLGPPAKGGCGISFLTNFIPSNRRAPVLMAKRWERGDSQREKGWRRSGSPQTFAGMSCPTSGRRRTSYQAGQGTARFPSVRKKKEEVRARIARAIPCPPPPDANSARASEPVSISPADLALLGTAQTIAQRRRAPRLFHVKQCYAETATGLRRDCRRR